MKILSFGSRNSLKSLWTFTPGGIIWRLLPPVFGKLVGESRDQDKKEVSFFAIDSVTGSPCWQNVIFDERWWIGIEEVVGNTLLLHKFAKPDMPEHRGILALDVISGRHLWANDELTYWFVQGNSLFAHKSLFERRIVFELNVVSGEIMKEYSEDEAATLLQYRSTVRSYEGNGLQFPEEFRPQIAKPEALRIIERIIPPNVVQNSIEFTVQGNYLLLAYHFRTNGKTDVPPLFGNRLTIADLRRGKTIYADTISDKLRAFVPDSFFVNDRIVYYIKNQRTLTAVRLDA